MVWTYHAYEEGGGQGAICPDLAASYVEQAQTDKMTPCTPATITLLIVPRASAK